MIDYLSGNITKIDDDHIYFESNKIGYKLLKTFEIDVSTTKIYVYVIKNDYNHEYYGFSSIYQRRVFSSLIKLKGVGPKTVKRLFDFYDFELVIKFVEEKNTDALVIVPGVGLSTANNIIGEISKDNNLLINEIINVLIQFGYRKIDIDQYLNLIEVDKDLNYNIKKIIKKI